MKSLFNLSLLAMLFAGLSLSAQPKTALHSNGSTTIFEGPLQFTNAYNAAVDGDTIYLPGGTFSNIPILNKSLTVFGAGIHPDSTSATAKTVLLGDLVIQQDADNSSLIGIQVTGGIYTSTNHKVDNLTISRCMFNELIIYGNQSNPCNFLLVRECIIEAEANLSNASFSTITNSFLQGIVRNGVNNAILNNILMLNTYWDPTLVNVDNSSIANNIIFKQNDLYEAMAGCDNNTLANNVFADVNTVGTNTFTNNYEEVDLSGVFVNQSGLTFDFTQDYHLVDPGLYTGNDNTQVGVYGGLYPFKDGSLPQNPHIRFKNIAPQTDGSGNLSIEIEVGAQDE
jgi:hypothetical protein